jgi:hypothetical protein
MIAFIRSTPTSENAKDSRYRMSGRSGFRFADKDMRQYENLPRFPAMLDHSAIQYDREAP